MIYNEHTLTLGVCVSLRPSQYQATVGRGHPYTAKQNLTADPSSTSSGVRQPTSLGALGGMARGSGRSTALLVTSFVTLKSQKILTTTTVLLLHDIPKYKNHFPFITAKEMHNGTELEFFIL